MTSHDLNVSRVDQLPNSINSISHCDDEVTLFKHVNETLLDVDDDTPSSKQVGGLIGSSNVASATLAIANVFDTMETCNRLEQNETQSRRNRDYQGLRFHHDWDSQRVSALTARSRFHKKLRILREARQKK